jgi:hypothetical protein
MHRRLEELAEFGRSPRSSVSVKEWLQWLTGTEFGRGWGVTLVVLNELARHLIVVLALVASVHLTAWFVTWIASATNTSVMTDDLIGSFKFKHLILMIDFALVAKLGYEGYRDIARIYAEERKRHERE